MVKLLLLQQLYCLSDDTLEYQVLDRTSFQHFLGLEHSRYIFVFIVIFEISGFPCVRETKV